MTRDSSPTDPFRNRFPASDVHPLAIFPRTLRLPTPAEEDRGIVIAYSTANFTVYRAVVDRLQPGERFRVETNFGAFEIPRQGFELEFAGIVASRAYLIGWASMPNKCYYVVGPPPVAARQFRVR